MSLSLALIGFVAALVIAAFTAPVGVSGAVFMLPVQLSVLHVPSPAVTPTNLLFNIVAVPGALVRYRHHLVGPLARRLIAGLRPRTITAMALAVGVAGGIYGIGGGSILGPILVGTGTSVATVAPPALASTFVTSLAGAVTYALLALTTTGDVGPNWPLGIVCGVGGLLGSYLGARLQRRPPESALKILLGSLAIGVGALYLVQAVT